MAVGGSALSRSSAINRLKRVYAPRAIQAYDFSTPFFSQIPKRFNLDGERFEQTLVLSGGAGAGTTSTGDVPVAGRRREGKAYYYPTENLSSIKITRAMLNIGKGENYIGNSAADDEISRGVERLKDNTERMLIDGSVNALGQIKNSAATDIVYNGSYSYTLKLVSSTFVEANFEEEDLVNIGSGSTGLWKIQEVDPDEANLGANPTITVVFERGIPSVPALNDFIYKQGSQNSGIFGLREMLSISAGSAYGFNLTRRWSAGYYIASYGQGPSTGLLDNMFRACHRKTGKVPTAIICSYEVHDAFKSLLEGQDRYAMTDVTPRFNIDGKWSADYKKMSRLGQFGWKAMAYDTALSPAPVPFFISKFLRRGELMALNLSDPAMLSLDHASGFGWMDEDGDTWAREPGKTNFSAVYGGEMQSWICLPYHAYVNGISV